MLDMLPRTLVDVLAAVTVVYIVFLAQISKAQVSPVTGCVVDLAFVVDNSGTIRDSSPPGRDNWIIIINFLKTLVSLIKVGPNGNHVGLVEFGNQGYLAFDFTAYTTAKGVIDALGRVKYRGENSNMTGGMRLARERLFDTKYGMRSDASHVMILVTGGKPTWDADKLPEEIERLKSMGIRIMVVGVTNQVDKAFLQSIVTQPYEQNYAVVENFESIDFIRSQLSIGSQMCRNVTANAATTPLSITATTEIASSATTIDTPTISTKAIPNEGCMVDVAFVLDNSASMESNWVMLVKFVKTLVTMLNVGPKGTRVGLVEFGDQGYLGFDFTNFTTKKEVIDAFSRLRFRGENSNMTSGIRLARERLFDTKYGMRPNAQHVMLLVTDGAPTWDADKLTEEIARIKNLNIRIMAVAVAVDKQVGESLLQSIVTQPYQTNYMFAEKFETLDKIRDQLISGACSNVDPNTVNTLPSIATTTPSTTTTRREEEPFIDAVYEVCYAS